MASLQQYIIDVKSAISNEDSIKLKDLISIRPQGEEGIKRSQFDIPSSADVSVLPERFQSVVTSYIQLLKLVYIQSDIKAAFKDLNTLTTNLIRAAESQTNWINLPLINACKELISVYQVQQKNFPDEEPVNDIVVDAAATETGKASPTLELLVTTINKAFKLSLTDKTLELEHSKRRDIYFFLGCLLQLYFKMGKLELAKSVQKAIKGTRLLLPNFSTKKRKKGLASPISSRWYEVSYLYYSALLYLDDMDFVQAEERLSTAFALISYYSDKEAASKHTERILLILIPLKLHNSRLTPSQELWDEFPTLREIYRDNLFKAVYNGNLQQFDECCNRYRMLFLKKYLFLLIEQLRPLCYLKLTRKVCLIYKELNKDPKTDHIVPLSAIQVAFEMSGFYGETIDFSERSFYYTLDALECILANLIVTGRIKGYISHSNKCIVLSRATPFPPQVIKP